MAKHYRLYVNVPLAVLNNAHRSELQYHWPISLAERPVPMTSNATGILAFHFDPKLQYF